MKHVFLSTLVLTAVSISPALAETVQTTSSVEASSGKYHTVRTLVGYEEKIIGRVIIPGDESYNGHGPLPRSAFNNLDTNHDGALSQSEMFANQHLKQRGSANFTSTDGTPGRSDYDARDAKGIIIEDLAGDGSFFHAMDTDENGFVTPDEFRTDIKQATVTTEADIEPAASGDMHAPAEYEQPVYSDPETRANKSYMGHGLNQ